MDTVLTAANRAEADMIGQRDLPADLRYGIHTQRAVENFALSGRSIDVFAALVRGMAMVCGACGGVHHEHEKPRLMSAGEWRPTAQGDGHTAGFHLSSLHSPWETWGEIAQEHARVARDPARLQIWVNTKMGESWEDQAGDTVLADPLMARREDWGSDLAPGVAVLTAGVDVQSDRLEVQIVGCRTARRCSMAITATRQRVAL